MKYGAELYPAADYGREQLSDKYEVKEKYLVEVNKANIEKLLKLLDDYLVAPDFSFRKTKEKNLRYKELDIDKAESLLKENHLDFHYPVLTDKLFTAYYAIDKGRYVPGVVYFIPTKRENGMVLVKECWRPTLGSPLYPGCTPEKKHAACYDDRHKTFQLSFEQKLPNDVEPLRPIINGEVIVRRTSYSVEYLTYRDTCGEQKWWWESKKLNPEQAKLINERIQKINNSLKPVK